MLRRTRPRSDGRAWDGAFGAEVLTPLPAFRAWRRVRLRRLAVNYGLVETTCSNSSMSATCAALTFRLRLARRKTRHGRSPGTLRDARIWAATPGGRCC